MVPAEQVSSDGWRNVAPAVVPEMEARHLAACQLERVAIAILAAVANHGKTAKGPTESGTDAHYSRDLETRATYALDQAEEFIRQLQRRRA